MKKAWILALALAALLALTACGDKKGSAADGSGEQVKTTGHLLVLESGGYMLIMEDDSPVSMTFRSKDSEWPEGLKSGDIAEVTYDGYIMESYPGQIIIDKCEKVGEGSLNDVPADLLEDLAAMGWVPADEND